MKSDLPKVLVPVAGQPMLGYVLAALTAAGVGRILVVVGYREELVREYVADMPGVECVTQAPQLGTGHAVMVCQPALQDYTGPVFVLAGDSPMIRPASLQHLLDQQRATPAACLMGTAHKADPTGLGRIVRDGSGQFAAIVEERDATPEQRQITEVNLSCYLFSSPDLFWALERVTRNNAQGEYYLTDCPGLLLGAGKAVHAWPILTARETLSINTPLELAAVEDALRDERPEDL